MLTTDVLAAASGSFPGRRGYLDSATYGLPSQGTVEALNGHVAEWLAGEGSLSGWDVAVSESRRLAAGLLGALVSRTAVGSQVSVAVGAVAASLPPGTRVVLAEHDFTSLTWPFLTRRDLRIRVSSLERLDDAISDGCDWVAVSTVQSGTGQLIDLDRLVALTAGVGARVLLDATQAAGWVPLQAERFDVVTVGAYKWLSCPRGAAFTCFSERALTELMPTNAGWYAGSDPLASLYLNELRLATDGRRFDVSPAWPCYAGAVPSLRLLADAGVEAIYAHNVALANEFRARLGLAPAASAIVCVDVDDEAVARLRSAGVRASSRAGRMRFAFHLYNDSEDVELAVRALKR